MTVFLHDTTGALIGTAEIPPFRAFPTFVFLAPLPGGYRFFRRVGPNVGDGADQYDEIKPVEAKLLTEAE